MTDPTRDMIACLTLLLEDPTGTHAAQYIGAMDAAHARRVVAACCCHIADLIRRHAEAERVEPRVVLRDIALTAAERAA